MQEFLKYSEEVADGITEGKAIVALESTVIAHGLPPPLNIETAKEMEAAVRTYGSLPATIAIIDGKIKVGLSPDEIDRIATGPNVTKVSSSDIAITLTSKSCGATTVASSLAIAHAAGIKVFATGGIGGVHPGASDSFDVSADLHELARRPLGVVATGAKSILDLPATLEVLESLAVPVVGVRTAQFPAFYFNDSGLKLSHKIDCAEDAAKLLSLQRQMRLQQAILFANPIPQDAALEREVVAAWARQARTQARDRGITGKALTPFLLRRISELSQGRTLGANRALLLNNARFAAEVAKLLQNPKHR
ncbi:MAG: pseudouridine-5'-phosphate glycosidase [Kiloniellales bacterium]|nr:pseudouridine-5'-phosphate glycosidase [Kiloniellales bacterium]